MNKEEQEPGQMQPVGERPNSCEISVTSKGLWSGRVKVYERTIGEAKLKAVAEAEELEKLIRMKNGLDKPA